MQTLHLAEVAQESYLQTSLTDIQMHRQFYEVEITARAIVVLSVWDLGDVEVYEF